MGLFTTHKPTRPTLGISRCLLGDAVRYDGKHKYCAPINKFLIKHARIIAVCPELESGLGVPRPPMVLIKAKNRLQAITNTPKSANLSQILQEFIDVKIPQLSELDGFIFKSNSPSCGRKNVPVYAPNLIETIDRTPGLFAGAFMQTYPLIPCEEEHRLTVRHVRELFYWRTCLYRRWKTQVGNNPRPSELRRFHGQHHKIFQRVLPEKISKQLVKLSRKSHRRNHGAASKRYIKIVMQGLEKYSNSYGTQSKDRVYTAPITPTYT